MPDHRGERGGAFAVQLADAIGRSPGYFHRIFKAATGLTPKDYAAAHRAKKIRQGLACGNTVTATIYETGFNSSGRFYEKADEHARHDAVAIPGGGAPTRKSDLRLDGHRLAPILVASSKKGVASIQLGDEPDELVRNLQDRFPKAYLVGADRDYEAFIARVVGCCRGTRIGLDLPLDVRCTAFEQRVWRALRDIPAGESVTYASIAQRTGSPQAA